MLTKKNYERIASLIRTTSKGIDGKSFEGTIKTTELIAGLTNYFFEDNERFDFCKFREACGYPDRLGNFPTIGGHYNDYGDYRELPDSSGWVSSGTLRGKDVN
jgi:hypothetical protein